MLLTAAFLSIASADCSTGNMFGTDEEKLDYWQSNYPWTETDVPCGTADDYSYCDLAQNDAFGEWPVNSDCNNAGTCIVHSDFQTMLAPAAFTWGKCQCADPSVAGNFVHADDGWDFQLFEGEICNEVEFKLFGTISYLIKFDKWDSTDPTRRGRADIFECNIGDDGSGVEFDTTNPTAETAEWHTIPNMTPLVKAVIQFNEYMDADETIIIEETTWETTPMPDDEERRRLAHDDDDHRRRQEEDDHHEDEGLYANGYRNYNGIVVPNYASSTKRQHCRICRDAAPCEIGVDTYGDEAEGGYMMVSFATNYNTYYNHDCEKLQGVMPIDQDGYQAEPECPENTDDGHSAKMSFTTATMGTDQGTHHKQHYLELARQTATTQVFYYLHEDDGHETLVFGMGWDNEIQITRTSSTETSVSGVSTNSLRFPTRSPTLPPTPTPTTEPTSLDADCFSMGYTHTIESLKFMGIAQAGSVGCRHGLDPSWPGGQTCGSPYVTCLPAENTPNTGFPMEDEGTYEAYLSNSAPYSLDQCKRECAYDQRCQGFEFNPSGEGKLGDCVLIDDIPLDMGTTANGGITTEADLDTADWGALGGSICFAKEGECNPYFGADDLSEVMLKCYCPNNRKGFYTKNVHRTVEATTFCGGDSDVTERIKEAQANRMFHLCENWCLFNTQSPRTESWYHDPWMKCWREQYAGVGTHRSYCYRVIRDPFTIEQFFIDTRSNNMCQTASPDFGGNPNTPSPTVDESMFPVTNWRLADEEESCDDVCLANSELCKESATNSVLNGAGNIEGFMTEAGVTCTSVVESDTTSPNGSHGWAAPAFGPDGICITRHADANKKGDGENDLYTGCNVAIGVGYQRLCACMTDAVPAGSGLLI